MNCVVFCFNSLHSCLKTKAKRLFFPSSPQLSPKQECLLPSSPRWHILNVSPHKMSPQSKILFYHAHRPQKHMKLFELVTVVQSSGIGAENRRQILLLLSQVSAFFFSLEKHNMWRNASACNLSAIILVWAGRKTEIELPSESYRVHSSDKKRPCEERYFDLVNFYLSHGSAQIIQKRRQGLVTLGCRWFWRSRGVCKRAVLVSCSRINRP